MTALLGTLCLTAGILVAAIAFVASIASVRLEMPSLLKLARWMIGLCAVTMIGASAALLTALLQSDFSNTYVAAYTERALPFGYKLAAFWAGQEGSLLLWGLMLTVMSAIHVFNRRDQQNSEGATVVATLAIMCGFFAALLLIADAANPFKVNELIPADGQGLNPLLQDPGMIAHPPALFLGYAGYAIPFAMMIGALLTGRKDNGWVAETRRWSLASWLFLSIGILLGAQWAYVELGWGGYWGWDPVENASLLPWLTGTALVHSIMVQQQRGMLKLWNAMLYAGTFVLCIFGTYLTRSGVIQSVHGFAPSGIATFFLTLIVLSTVFSIVLLFVRRKQLQAEHELETLLGKEGMFLATNVVLTGIMLITLIGTIFPIISNLFSGLFAGQQVTVGPSFYNKVISPLGMLLAAMMAMGPALGMGADAAHKLIKSMLVPIAIGVVGAGVMYALGTTSVYALICTMITVTLALTILVNFVKQVIARVQIGENPVTAVFRLIDGNHRRYGGQIVHVGVMMMIVGITGSTLFQQKNDVSIKQGETTSVAGYQIKYEGLKEDRKANYSTVEATFVLTDEEGKSVTLKPERRFFDKSQQPYSQVAIQTNTQKDLFVNLAGWEARGEVVAIQFIVNPLVLWIWIGGIVMTAGALFCLLPKFTELVAAETVPQPNTPVTPVVHSKPKKFRKRREAVGAA